MGPRAARGATAAAPATTAAPATSFKRSAIATNPL